MKARLGYVPESGALFEKFSPARIPTLIGPPRIGCSEGHIRRPHGAGAASFGLEADKDRPWPLSKGTKQRVCWISALLHDPEVLVLDEPLNGLDVETVAHVKEMMRRSAEQGRTIFYSSHLIDIVEKVCTRIAVIHAGQPGERGHGGRGRGRVPGAASLEQALLALSAERGAGMSAVAPDGGASIAGPAPRPRPALPEAVARARDRNGNTGSREIPCCQILLSMTTLGVMLSAAAWRAADLPSYLVLVFAAVFVIVILAINPDSQDVQERRLEILGSKPIAPRTFLSARTISSSCSRPARGCLGLAPLAVAVVHFGLAWPRAAAAYLTLDRGVLRGGGALALGVLMVSLRWIPLDRRARDPPVPARDRDPGDDRHLPRMDPGSPPRWAFSIAAWPEALLAPSSWFALLLAGRPLAGSAVAACGRGGRSSPPRP